ncbi:MAG: PAS domain S-box protein, partial [Thermoplasmata archaeon]
MLNRSLFFAEHQTGSGGGEEKNKSKEKAERGVKEDNKDNNKDKKENKSNYTNSSPNTDKNGVSDEEELLTGKSVLIVEEDVIVAMDLEGIITSLGHKVVGTATSGKEAVEKALVLTPDLILMDISLGDGMSGIEAAQKIRKFADIPVIYCTAYSSGDVLKSAKMTNPYGFVVKPYNEREIAGAIEVALLRHKLDRKLSEQNAFVETLLESIPSPVFYTDIELKYKGCNRAYEEFFDVKKEELIGKTAFDLFPEHIASEINSTDRKVLTEKSMMAYEMQLKAYDSSIRDVIVWKRPIVHRDGSICGIIGIITDITEQKEYGRRLEQKKKEIELLAKTAEEFLELKPDEDVFIFLAKILQKQNPASLVFTLGYDSENSKLAVKAMEGPEEFTMVLRTVISAESGRDVVGKLLYINEEELRKVPTDFMVFSSLMNFKDYHPSLNEKNVLIDEFLKYRNNYVYRMAGVDGETLGVVVLSLPARSSVPELSTIKGIIKQASLSIVRRKSEIKLKEREEQFRVISENLEDILFTMDLDLNIVYVSEGVKKTLGYTPGEFRTLPLNKQMTKNSFELFMDKIVSAFSEDRLKETNSDVCTTFDIEYLTKDGQPVWFSTTLVLVRNEYGLPKLIVGISRYIDSEKKYKIELEKSESQYRRVIETAGEGIIMMDADEKITFVNKRLADYLGLTVEEILGTNLRDFIMEEDMPDHLIRMANRRAGKSEVYVRRLKTNTRPCGYMWFQVSATPIIEDGQYKGSFFMLGDIDSLLRAKERLEKSLMVFEHLFEDVTTGVIILEAVENGND